MKRVMREEDFVYRSRWRRDTFDPNAPVVRSHQGLSPKRSPILPRRPSFGSFTRFHPRLVCLARHWRGYFIPVGTISSKRFKRIFEPTPTFVSTHPSLFNKDILLQDWIENPPRSVPADTLPLLVRLARKQGFKIFINRKEITNQDQAL